MKLIKAYYFRLYPNKEDQVLLSKHFGSTRFIYNTMLKFKKFYYEKLGINLSHPELCKALTHLKKLDEYSWLNEVNSQTLQATLKDLDQAFKNFYNKRAKFPKFKSKKTHRFSFRVPQFVKLEDNRLFITKFKKGIKVKQHREIIGTIKNATITLNPSGKYYVSLIVEYDSQVLAKPQVELNSATGVDLGIKTYATLSDGTKIFYPLYLEKNLIKLKELQAKFSKSKSKRVRLDIAKLHEKIANQRSDFLHKLTKELVTKYDSIAIEDLDIVGLIQNENKDLSRKISDCSWFTFRQQLTYKADLYGCNLIVIPKFYPSSKLCHKCNYKNDNLKLTDREYICPNCGLTLDRDYNASLNILKVGLGTSLVTT